MSTTSHATLTRAATGDPWPFLVLPARLVLFAVFQAGFAVALGSWEASIAWWPLCVPLANLVTIGLLIWLFRREGQSYFALFRPDFTRVWPDVLISVGVLAVAAPLTIFPNILLSQWLFGAGDGAMAVFLQPLPLWAAVLAISFPITIVLAELPAYFGYAMPRIAAATGRPLLAVLLAGFFLALQHVALPLVFDASFLAWRLLMFLPFALWIGLVLLWRPRLLPYLVIAHGLLDASIVVMLFQIAE